MLLKKLKKHFLGYFVKLYLIHIQIKEILLEKSNVWGHIKPNVVTQSSTIQNKLLSEFLLSAFLVSYINET